MMSLSSILAVLTDDTGRRQWRRKNFDLSPVRHGKVSSLVVCRDRRHRLHGTFILPNHIPAGL